MYWNVDEFVGRFRCINSLQQHRALVLVEEFGCFVDVVICSRVGATDNHDCQSRSFGRVGMVDAIVVYWWLEEVRVLLEPALSGQRMGG